MTQGELERRLGRRPGRGVRRAARRRRRSGRPRDEPVGRRHGASPAAAARRNGLARAPRHARFRRARTELTLADRVQLRARSSLIVAEAATASGGAGSGAPTVETIDKLANAAGIAADWWDVGGKRTIVSAETKIALLDRARPRRRERSAGARQSSRGSSTTPRAAACPSRSCCASAKSWPRRCATRRARSTRESCATMAPSPNGASRPLTAPGATCRTDARSPSARSSCPRCRPAATASSSTASNAR